MKKYIVSCCVKQSIVARTGRFKPTTVSYCAYELGVHAFLKSDLIVEVMYNGKDITLLGPHVCYTVHILYNGNLCNEI